MAKLTKTIIDAAAPAEKPYFLWCSALRGFACRVQPSGKKTFYVDYRTDAGARKRMKIGDYGKVAPEQARKMAVAAMGAVVAGDDPLAERVSRRSSLTVAQVAHLYLEAARGGLVVTRFGQPKRASTLKIDEGRIARHIVPLIGAKRAAALTRQDVQRMADAIAGGATSGRFKTGPRGLARVDGGHGAAGRVVELLGGVWSWAERRGLVEGRNPAHGVERRRGAPKSRTLSVAELARLGAVLEAQEPIRPAAVAALRLIALTGLRRDEACRLRWSECDLENSCLRLAQTKTGASMRAIGAPAVALLAALPRRGQFVFPSRDGKSSYDAKKAFVALFNAAGLADARAHDLRRTFASLAAEIGLSDGIVSDLLGHARRGVTQKHYIRRPDATLIDAAGRVSREIAVALTAANKKIS